MQRQWIAATTASLALAACATTDGGREIERSRAESNPAGVKGLLDGDDLRRIDIASLVSSFVPPGAPAPGISVGDPLDLAIARFYASPGLSEVQRASYRNEIQDRIIAASNQRCHLWKNYFATASSTVGFWSGFLGAATGAAALAFSPTDTKQALTALSTTSTSVGTQYEKSYLYNLTMSVIFQGVEGRRAEILKSIREKRSEETTDPATKQKRKDVIQIGRYSLSAAIADGLEYHAACSLASGLQQASEKLADTRGTQTEPTREPAKPGSEDTADKAADKGKPPPTVQPPAAQSRSNTTSSPASVPLF